MIYEKGIGEMWWWRKVRKANITPELRKRFETYGEIVIAQAVADPNITMDPGDLPALIRSNYATALDWLIERRDIHERREDRPETLEWAILIFVVVGVIVESGLGGIISTFVSRLF